MNKQIEKEVYELHQAFQGWYNGSIASSDIETTIGQRLSDNFYIVFPDSTKHSKQDLLSMLSRDQGNDAAYRIEIKYLDVEALSESVFLATYQEWQYWDGAPSPNLKLQTSATLRVTNGKVRWVFIHETAIQ